MKFIRNLILFALFHVAAGDNTQNIGIGVGVTLALLLLGFFFVVLYYFYIKQQRKLKKNEHPNSISQQSGITYHQNLGYVSDDNGHPKNIVHNRINYDDIINIAYNNITNKSNNNIINNSSKTKNSRITQNSSNSIAPPEYIINNLENNASIPQPKLSDRNILDYKSFLKCAPPPYTSESNNDNSKMKVLGVYHTATSGEPMILIDKRKSRNKNNKTVGSFSDYPSMADVLLTSSRQSIPLALSQECNVINKNKKINVVTSEEKKSKHRKYDMKMQVSENLSQKRDSKNKFFLEINRLEKNNLNKNNSNTVEAQNIYPTKSKLEFKRPVNDIEFKRPVNDIEFRDLEINNNFNKNYFEKSSNRELYSDKITYSEKFINTSVKNKTKLNYPEISKDRHSGIQTTNKYYNYRDNHFDKFIKKKSNNDLKIKQKSNSLKNRNSQKNNHPNYLEFVDLAQVLSPEFSPEYSADQDILDTSFAVLDDASLDNITIPDHGFHKTANTNKDQSKNKNFESISSEKVGKNHTKRKHKIENKTRNYKQEYESDSSSTNEGPNFKTKVKKKYTNSAYVDESYNHNLDKDKISSSIHLRQNLKENLIIPNITENFNENFSSSNVFKNENKNYQFNVEITDSRRESYNKKKSNYKESPETNKNSKLFKKKELFKQTKIPKPGTIQSNEPSLKIPNKNNNLDLNSLSKNSKTIGFNELEIINKNKSALNAPHFTRISKDSGMADSSLSMIENKLVPTQKVVHTNKLAPTLEWISINKNDIRRPDNSVDSDESSEEFTEELNYEKKYDGKISTLV